MLLAVSTHSRPKAAGEDFESWFKYYIVSTHSRPKAAGFRLSKPSRNTGGFNTQPPKGGWLQDLLNNVITANVSTHSRPKAAGKLPFLNKFRISFQHTAAQRRLGLMFGVASVFQGVSTHSRPKVAGTSIMVLSCLGYCFNTQPPKGGWVWGVFLAQTPSSFNTQPPKGGWELRRGNAVLV